MLEEKPSYYAVIPANVRYDRTLRANEKLLFGEITALSSKSGECFASNNYFAKLYNVTPQAISKWITELSEKGYLTIEYITKEEKKSIEKRIIRIEHFNENKVSTNIDRVSTNDLGGYQQKFKDNNIYNINNNIISGSNNNSHKNEIKEIIEYMNNVAKEDNFKIKKYFSFKSSTNATIKILNARFNEGWSKDELLDVVYLAYDKFVEHEFKGLNNRSSINYFNPTTIFTSEKVQKYKNEYDNL